jgi:Ca2+-binding RTX toxin-like protein
VAIRIGNSGNNILNGTSGSDLLLGSGRSWQIAFHPSRQ